jgi:hypothetical protein
MISDPSYSTYFYYGELPTTRIDHINEDPSDNRICNLRLATHKQNMQNKSSPQANNTSGYRGVHYSKVKLKGRKIFNKRWSAF